MEHLSAPIAYVDNEDVALDRPNVVVIVLDDTGFSELGCYGSAIRTPYIDEIAANGIRYNNFHATAWCAPTRACLLTGRNHHSVGMGFFPHAEFDFPGYTGRIPKSAGTLAQILQHAGYNTCAVGKWHLTPRAELHPAGPFDRWPLGMGFERFYGFLGGYASQWAPNLVCDNGFVDTPSPVDTNYHLTEDLASRAIRFLKDQRNADPKRPFFLYFAPGATHWPHQVSREWMEPYKNRFDAGWEILRAESFARQGESGLVPSGTVLTERPSWVPAWKELSRSERQVFSRQMEVYAGFLTHADAHIGRILQFLKDSGEVENTLLIVLSDNGAAGDAGPDGAFNVMNSRQNSGPDAVLRHLHDLGGTRSYSHYSWSWAWAGNTPFRLWKRYTWLGGVRVPLIIQWPRKIAGHQKGTVRDLFCHAIDLMPTVLDACGVETPGSLNGVKQQPIDGRSFHPLLTDAGFHNARKTQYFEAMGSRAIYHDGWFAVTDHVGKFAADRRLVEGSHNFDENSWNLFNLADDFSQARDVGRDHPERLKEMIDLWWSEALRYHVLPVMDDTSERAYELECSRSEVRQVRTYLPGAGAIITPRLAAGFSLTVELEVPPDREFSGIICAQGDWNLGWACYALSGRVVVTFNIGERPERIVSAERATAGLHEILVSYAPSLGSKAVVTLTVDGHESGEARVSGTLEIPSVVTHAEMLTISHDEGLPVCDDYMPPFPLTARVRRLTLEVPNKAGYQGKRKF